MAIAPVVIGAQDHTLSDRVMQAVGAAMAPALPFPASDALGSLPADGRSDAPWMVRPIQPGERTLEILANPLNEDHQRRASKAMAEIGASIEAAQRRAEVQFERAVAEAKRTGRSQDVDGVTLSDEGIAGARIDAESHVTIEVLFNQPAYRLEVESSVPPNVTYPPGLNALVLAVPQNIYRDDRDQQRLCEAETYIFMGRFSPPAVGQRGKSQHVLATSTVAVDESKVSSLVLRLRGNEALIADLLRKSNWNSLLELLK